ncbi:MAG: hypothetical protein ACRDD8_11715 [Bacteroidales bacterium]
MTNRELYKEAISEWFLSIGGDVMTQMKVMNWSLGGLTFLLPAIKPVVKNYVEEYFLKFTPDESIDEVVGNVIDLSLEKAQKDGKVEVFGVDLTKSDIMDLKNKIAKLKETQS